MKWGWQLWFLVCAAIAVLYLCGAVWVSVHIVHMLDRIQ